MTIVTGDAKAGRQVIGMRGSIEVGSVAVVAAIRRAGEGLWMTAPAGRRAMCPGQRK